MKEILKKLNKVKAEIITRKSPEKLRFFGLVLRIDFEDRWDVLISADWVDESNTKDDLIFIIELLKKEFDNLSFISNIVLQKPKEKFMYSLAKAIIAEGKVEGEKEYKKLNLPELNFILKHLCVVYFDYDGIDLTEQVPVIEPVASEKIDPFITV